MVPKGCESLAERIDALESAANPPSLTKREYFAGLAMAGMQSNPEFTGNTAAERARFAVVEADALLAELEKAK